MNHLLGIDIGTSGVKALLVDEKGTVIASASEAYDLDIPQPGWAQQDADMWWDATCRAVSRLTANVDVSKIAAAGLSGQMHGLVPLDNHNKPLRPAILWCDQRPVRECEWLTERFHNQLIDITCNPPLAGFTLPKILWMKNNEQELFAKMESFLLPKDYIRYRMTGEKAIDISDAAGTLMLDIKRGDWARELMAEIGVPEKLLPPVVASDAACGTITAEAAKATGLPEGLPVAAGGADNTCAAVGTGIVQPGRVSSSIGSSGVIFAHTAELKKDPQARVHSFNHSVPGAFYLMGVMLSAGLSFKWFRDTLGQAEKEREAAGGPDAYELLSKQAQEAPPGSGGLVFLPYLTGERTPHKDPYARGVFHGISLGHGRSHMIRAVMEGIVFGLKDSLNIIRELGVEVKEIRACGGGGKSEFWRQIQADVFGAPVSVVEQDEGPALGAALLGGVSAGVYPDVAAASDAAVKVVSVTEPDASKTEIYSKTHERFKELYISLKESFRSI